MKKIILLLSFLVPAMLFAGNTGKEASFKIRNLIEADKNLSPLTINKINGFAGDLSLSDNRYLYDSYKKEATVPFVLNFFVGMGVGSFYQGDTVGGVVGLTGDLLVSSAIIFVYYQFWNEGMKLNDQKAAYTNDSQQRKETLVKIDNLYDQFVTNMLIVGGVSAGVKLFQYIRPFSYAKSYNNKLRESLNPTFSMAPILNNNGDMGFRLGASINL